MKETELESETPACVTSIHVICFYGIILCVISVYIVQCFVLPLFTLSCVNSECIISLISVFVSSFHLCFSCGYKCFCPSVVCVIRVHYAMFCVISVLHYPVIKKNVGSAFAVSVCIDQFLCLLSEFIVWYVFGPSLILRLRLVRMNVF